MVLLQPLVSARGMQPTRSFARSEFVPDNYGDPGREVSACVCMQCESGQ